METNDFLGSFADENVTFATRIVKNARVGQNYWTTMVFLVGEKALAMASGVTWEDVPSAESQAFKVTSINGEEYAEKTTGMLQKWMYDLFANGNSYECILVKCADAAEMKAAYDILKAYAYHKTVLSLLVPEEDESAINFDTDVIVDLAKLMQQDYGLLSGVPLLPYATAIEVGGNPNTDPILSALTGAKVDAFLSAQQDINTNASLYSLGLALSIMDNGSGTPVGNGFDMWASGQIGCSGKGGLPLAREARKLLTDNHIQVWKYVGDNTGNVAAEGGVTLKGDVYSAIWMKAYITYMVKVGVAKIMTEPNFIKNEINYGRCVTVMSDMLGSFVSSGRLTDLAITVPSFAQLPEGSEIVINDAWKGTYVDVIRKVSITGILYISADAGMAA